MPGSDALDTPLYNTAATGLADRSELMARLETLLAGERLADQRFAVLFVDLDHFKQVNDQYGHLVGDRVLSEVAQRLVRCTRTHDQVFRYGGDEFVVLVEQATGEHEIEPVVARIHAEAGESDRIQGEDVCLSVSVAPPKLAPEHRTPEDLLFFRRRPRHVRGQAARARTRSALRRISVESAVCGPDTPVRRSARITTFNAGDIAASPVRPNTTSVQLSGSGTGVYITAKIRFEAEAAPGLACPVIGSRRVRAVRHNAPKYVANTVGCVSYPVSARRCHISQACGREEFGIRSISQPHPVLVVSTGYSPSQCWL